MDADMSDTDDETEGNRQNRERDAKGRFQPGCKPGPGRPQGTLQLQHLVAREVAKGDLDPVDAVRRLLTAMVLKGEQGDAQAAKVALDRLGPLVQQHAHLHAHAHAVTRAPVYPQPPQGEEAKLWWDEFRRVGLEREPKMVEFIKTHGRLPKQGEPLDAEEAAAAKDPNGSPNGRPGAAATEAHKG